MFVEERTAELRVVGETTDESERKEEEETEGRKASSSRSLSLSSLLHPNLANLRSHRSCLRLSSPSSSSTKSRSDPFFTGLPRSRISPGSPAPAYDQADRAESRCRDSTLAVRDSSREDRNAFLVSYASSRFALSSSGRDGLSSSSSSSSTATPAFQQS
jgi:hypothetical protein